DINFSNMNLLCGSNSVGKSTIIQSLLLLKQNQRELLYSQLLSDGGQMKNFSINGHIIKLGAEESLLNYEAESDEYKIHLDMGKLNICVSNDRDSGWKAKINSDKEKLEARSYFELNSIDDIKYLSTNRIKPQITYDLSKIDIEQGSIGIGGEYTAHFLAQYKSRPIKNTAFVHPASKTNHLLENVSNWLTEISGNISVNAKVINEAQAAAITYKYAYGLTQTNDITPLNVGFGITHVLPVITLLLTAEEGDCLIIENPEAQLHPSGQAKIAHLMSIVAASGVQLIVETHSDHILNAVRVATKEKVITPELSKVYFFDRDKEALSARDNIIQIDNEGGINQWPKGFFDEWDKQLDKLIW
ncbi:AAA family ATPase, partial [Vibrio splendidus]|uniref:AAA family ATPase n=1 Tax=Vibrio splendidus TaxID=29497 RepID=UPI000C819148